MYLHTILSEILHIIKKNTAYYEKSTLYDIQSPYKTVSAFLIVSVQGPRR